MAGWKYYDGAFGNSAAKYKETINGVVVEARLYDCDGDYVEWSVIENGRVVVNDTVAADHRNGISEEAAWKCAKKRAELVICLGTERIKQLAREKANGNGTS